MLQKLTPYLVLALIAVLVFSGGLFTSKEIISYDDRPLVAKNINNLLPESRGNWPWNMNGFIGRPGNVIVPSHQLLVARLFSPVFYMKFMYFLSILLSGIFFLQFMRDFKLHPLAALFGAVAWMLTNSILTLALPGHLGKFMVTSFMPLVFLFLRRAVIRDLYTNYIYAGIFLGFTVMLGAYELSFFYGVLLFFYWIFLLLRKRGTEKLVPFFSRNWKKIASHKAGLLALGLVMIITMAAGIPGLMHVSTVRTSEAGAFRQSTQERWDWATQWSVPPFELLDLVVPGLSGWKTGHPEYPYFGDLGRSPDGGKSLRNLKLAIDHIGLSTMIFLIAGLFLNRKNRESEHRFWLWAMVVTIALSLGKYLYVPYWLFHQLPFMDAIRNPNKFMQVAVFIMALLAACGLHRILTRGETDRSRMQKIIAALKYLTWGLLGISLLSLVFRSTLAGIIESAGAATTAAHNIAGFWPLAFLLAGAVSAAVWYLLRLLDKTGTHAPRWIPWALVALVTAELWYGASWFIGFQDPGERYEPDRLTAVFEQTGVPARTFFLAHPNFTASLQDRFQYHNLNLVTYQDVMGPQTGRPQILVKQFSAALHALLLDTLQTGLTNPARHGQGWRYLELLGVSHVAAMADIKDPRLTALHRFQIQGSPQPLTVYRLNTPQPRLSVQYRYRVADKPEEAAALLGATNQPPLVLDQAGLREAGNPLLPPPLSGTNTPAHSLAVKHFGHNRIELEVYTAEPGLLCLLDQYHKDWRVRVNGKAGVIVPVNVFARGIPLEKGTSRVSLHFAPPVWPLALTLTGYGIGILVFTGEWLRKKRKKA